MNKRNPNTLNLDNLNTLEVVKKINDEDKKVAYAIEEQLENIAKAVEIIREKLEAGGRLFYIGCGTSGKLGVIDASECPPTFGVEDSMVQAIISGGEAAVSGWLEHTEDNEELALEDIRKKNINGNDVLVGISASGNTPYVRKAMEYGNELGCKTIGIICSTDGRMKNVCDLTIAVEVGPEVIMGSTRMKAGTAQKMILNMISTSVMIKLGKTYSNLMVNVKPINKKLQNRVKEIVQLATDVTMDKVEEVLKKCNYNPKIAIVVIKKDLDIESAEKALSENKGKIYEVLK